MFILDGQPLQFGLPFAHNGVDYPGNWLQLASPDDRAAIGIIEIPDYPRPDDRFFWVTQNNDWTWTAIPKDLSYLKNQWVDIIKHQTYGLLLPSDWMVVRKIEDGTPIPADWATYRAAVRTTCAQVITDLEATTDIEAFITAVTTVQWPKDPNAVDVPVA